MAKSTKTATGVQKYYNTQAIDKLDAHYNFVIGERSNGKTTALLVKIIRDYYERGKNGAIIRQMDEDIKGHKGASLFSGAVDAGLVAQATDGEFDGVRFYNRAYYLTRTEEDGSETREKEPFAHIFAISQAHHYKSNSYPNIGTIMFDEFLRADRVHLVDEVSMFLNLISTLVRDKADARIYLVANTVTWNSPYFKSFGLKDVAKMEPGQLAKFTHNEKVGGSYREMRVAVEYCEDSASYGGKPSDVYFIIDDSSAAMITDGKFAIPEYPKCPHAFTSKNVKCTYWILSDEGILRARLMKIQRHLFVFVDRVYDEVFEKLKDDRRDLFYSLEFASERNHFTAPLIRYADPRTHYLYESLAANRMFFETNETGEDFMYYVHQSREHSVMTL